jgi:hypothetical protein
MTCINYEPLNTGSRYDLCHVSQKGFGNPAKSGVLHALQTHFSRALVTNEGDTQMLKKGSARQQKPPDAPHS